MNYGTVSIEPVTPPTSLSLSGRLLLLFQNILTAMAVLLLAPLAIVSLLLLSLSGLGPLWELLQSHLDQRCLNNLHHPEMFLLEVPRGAHSLSGGHSYHIMVRLTQPAVSRQLPAVIFVGGLASNLMTMSRHQDQLTARHGFTVVNYDRFGVGLSDPFPANVCQSPSAADVAREMNHVLTHCDAILNSHEKQWIAVGASMGANVAMAFMTLFPNRLSGLLNLDGLPHAFLTLMGKKFLCDGKRLLNIVHKLRWTGIPRLMLSVAMRSVIPVMGEAFTKRQILGVLCRKQFFVTTGWEYATLMSCCDLEIAAWGKLSTTEYDNFTLAMLASLAPDESVVVNEGKGESRVISEERSSSELGERYLTKNDAEIQQLEQKLRSIAVRKPDDGIDVTKTHSLWPQPIPRHPVGNLIGGIDCIAVPLCPLATQFQSMVVRIMCARDYTGLERDYTQEARNHAAARCSVLSLIGGDTKVYYYPRLSHLNLWQQVSEIVEITNEIAQVVVMKREQVKEWEGANRTYII